MYRTFLLYANICRDEDIPTYGKVPILGQAKKKHGTIYFYEKVHIRTFCKAPLHRIVPYK